MPKGRHLGSQNGAKIDPKTIQNRSRFSRTKKHSSRPSWERLGAILIRSGDPSWVIFLNLAGVLQWFRENHYFRKNDVSRCVLEPLGAIWAPERAQKGGQKGPKRHQKRIQNDINFVIDFWIDSGPIVEISWDRLADCAGPGWTLLNSKNSKNFSKTNPDTLRPFGWRRI